MPLALKWHKHQSIVIRAVKAGMVVMRYQQSGQFVIASYPPGAIQVYSSAKWANLGEELPETLKEVFYAGAAIPCGVSGKQ